MNPQGPLPNLLPYESPGPRHETETPPPSSLGPSQPGPLGREPGVLLPVFPTWTDLSPSSGVRNPLYRDVTHFIDVDTNSVSWSFLPVRIEVSVLSVLIHPHSRRDENTSLKRPQGVPYWDRRKTLTICSVYVSRKLDNFEGVRRLERSTQFWYGDSV